MAVINRFDDKATDDKAVITKAVINGFDDKGVDDKEVRKSESPEVRKTIDQRLIPSDGGVAAGSLLLGLTQGVLPQPGWVVFRLKC